MARVNNLAHLLNHYKLCVSIALIALSAFSSANPPIINFSHNMRILKLPNNTKVGSIIYRIKGTDADNDFIEFGVRGMIGNRLLDFKNVSFYESDVYLKIPLEEKQYEITIFASDGKYFTEVESTIMVTESISFNESPFVSSDHIIRIPESTTTNETIATIGVRKKENSNLPVTFELRGSDKFAIKYVFGPGGTSNAEIYLVRKVDYEKQNIYILTIVALNAWTNETLDTRNIALIDKIVAIVDIQDTPPVFTNLPNVVKIAENTKVGTIIFTLSAEDGDYGSQRNITYDLDQRSTLRSYFAIDETKGSIVLRRPVQDIKDEIGIKEPMILTVRAIEVTSADDTMPAMSTDSSIVLVVVSTDNRRPHFQSQHLIGSIDENSQLMTPVRWEGMSVPQVYDDDPGLNGTMVMDISDPSDTFMIQPKRGINEIIFSIIVKDMKHLDYESSSDKQFMIKVSATDQSPYIQLNSTILCTIKLIDLNDNIPQFSRKTYEASIPEDAEPGTTVIKIEATDLDSGDYGEVRYTAINGPLSDDLKMDSKTGIVVLTDNQNIDRELVSEYRMTIEARDESGRGNKNVTELLIKILDSNDNAPEFLQSRYDAILNPDRMTFTQPLKVKALDADEPGTPNSNVSYEIVGGNILNKFVINQSSGEITLNSPLIEDKYYKMTNNFNDYQSVKYLPVINLTVKAHDQGIPHQSNSVRVYIHNPDFLNRTVTFIIADSVENVEQRKELIESGISTLSGATVHISSVSSHRNKEMTEVNTWIAYPTNTSVDLNKTPIILSQIIGKEYNNLENREENRVQFAGNDFRLLFWLLIILILATLIFLIVFLICWFCFCRTRIRSREKLRDLEESNYLKAANGSVVSDKTSKDKKHRKSKDKKRVNVSVQAWNEEVGNQSLKSSFRPSSAPNNEQNHYIQNVRANSSQSDQYLSQNPTLYHRVHKLNRHQRTRVGPQYYDSYEPNDMQTSLSDYRIAYNSNRLPNNLQIRSFKGVDNMGYLRTTTEPYLSEDPEEHSIHRTHPAVHHLPYNEKLVTLPKRTEILYIQSPTVETHEDLLRSISQNESHIRETQLNRYSDPSQTHYSTHSDRESDRMKMASKPKARQIYYTDHNVSDMIIPEEAAVPGMVLTSDRRLNKHSLAVASVSGVNQSTPVMNEDKHKQQMSESHSMNEKREDSSDSTRYQIHNENHNEINETENSLQVEKSADNRNENMNYSPYYDESIQITSVSGVPVSIELKEGLKKTANKSKANESVVNNDKRNVKNKRVLTKENSFENSEKSYDSDSGIGRSVPNPKISLDMKNSGLMEKKSIFTIAYNDVKTRHLQSAESNAE